MITPQTKDLLRVYVFSSCLSRALATSSPLAAFPPTSLKLRLLFHNVRPIDETLYELAWNVQC